MEKVIEFITNYMEMILMMFYYKALLNGKKKTIGSFVFYSVYTSVYTIWYFVVFPAEYWYMNTLMWLGITCAMSLMYEAKKTTRFFAAIVYFVLGLITEILAGVIISIVFSEDNYVEAAFLGNILSRMLMLLIVILIATIIKRKMHIIDKSTQTIMVAMPIISSITICIISKYLASGTNAIPLGAVGILILILNFMMYFFLQKVTNDTLLREQKKMIIQQLEHQKEKYSQTLKTYQKINGILHDTNKHMIYIDSLIQNGESKKASEYINSITNKIKTEYSFINTKNLALDSILNNAANIAKNNNVEFNMRVNVDEDILNKLFEYDICIVLGNLLDNANNAVLECKEDNRVINISIVTSMTGIHIETSNTYIAKREKLEKEDGLIHGFGLINIQSIVDKYNGGITVEQGDYYEVYVTIPLVS